MGVRISTSTKKLSNAVKASARALGYRCETGAVQYSSQRNLDLQVREIARSLQEKFDLETAAKILYLKREAFEHECEWRATIYCPDANRATARNGVSVKINPHKVIDSILLDPRAPQELVDAFTYYFKEKLNFKGRVARSVLYKSPTRIQLVD
jgi:hypothetical protein